MSTDKRPVSGLYLIVDDAGGWEDVARAGIAGGARVIQLRGKSMPVRELYTVAVRLREITADAGVLFIVNDSVELALASHADGVHLGQDDMPLEMARRLMGPDRIIGVSTHSVRQATVAEAGGADYIGFGPIFKQGSKKDHDPIVGISGLREIRSLTSLPIFAIGGIQSEQVREVMQAGANGIAVVSDLDPGKIVGARKGSPLLIGVGDKENFVASDASAIVDHTRQVVYLSDGEVAEITSDRFRTMTIDDVAVEKEVEQVTFELAQIERALSLVALGNAQAARDEMGRISRAAGDAQDGAARAELARLHLALGETSAAKLTLERMRRHGRHPSDLPGRMAQVHAAAARLAPARHSCLHIEPGTVPQFKSAHHQLLQYRVAQRIYHCQSFGESSNPDNFRECQAPGKTDFPSKALRKARL